MNEGKSPNVSIIYLDRYTEIEKENRRLLEKMTGMLKSRRRNSLFNSKHKLIFESILAGLQFSTRQSAEATE